MHIKTTLFIGIKIHLLAPRSIIDAGVTYIYTHTHIYIYVYIHIKTTLYIGIKTRCFAPRAIIDAGVTYIHTHTHVYIYVYVCIFIYIYMCVCIHMCHHWLKCHIRIHTHTHICTYIYIYTHIHICTCIRICLIIDSGGAWLICRTYVCVTWLTCPSPSAVIDPIVALLFCPLNLGMKSNATIGSMTGYRRVTDCSRVTLLYGTRLQSIEE